MFPSPRLVNQFSATLQGQLNWTGPIANGSDIRSSWVLTLQLLSNRFKSSRRPDFGLIRGDFERKFSPKRTPPPPNLDEICYVRCCKFTCDHTISNQDSLLMILQRVRQFLSLDPRVEGIRELNGIYFWSGSTTRCTHVVMNYHNPRGKNKAYA